MEKPEFKSDVPDYLLKGRSELEVWMCQSHSINRQQTEWICGRLAEGDKRFREQAEERARLQEQVQKLEERTVVIERVKERLSAKWAVVAFLLASVLGPVALAFLGAWLSKWKP